MRRCATFTVHDYKLFPPASHSRVKSSSREQWLRSRSWKRGTCRGLGIKLPVPAKIWLSCGETPSTLYHSPLPTLYCISVISQLATSVTANGFYFHYKCHQVCRLANGHKYSTYFLKLGLDFGSNGRTPHLWSILVLFQKGLSIPALAPAILLILYLAQHSWL